MDDFQAKVTIGEKYSPAMEITEPVEAAAYFEKCVRHTMAHGNSREEAESIERANLGYFAGYYSEETRERVERLFHCAHSVFWSIAEHGAPTAEVAFQMGVELANKKKG